MRLISFSIIFFQTGIFQVLNN